MEQVLLALIPWYCHADGAGRRKQNHHLITDTSLDWSRIDQASFPTQAHTSDDSTATVRALNRFWTHLLFGAHPHAVNLLDVAGPGRMVSKRRPEMADRFDFTAREAERLRAENLLAQGKRHGRIVSDETGTYIEEPGIWDPISGSRLSPDEEAKAKPEDEAEGAGY
jgi:hypothetical protein